MSEDGKKTVLVVEDQNEISENMTTILTRKGYCVLRASDAEGALAMADKIPVAMILTDLELPTLDRMIDLLHAHQTLKHVLVGVVDINHPSNFPDGIRIFNSFDEIDQTLSSHYGAA